METNGKNVEINFSIKNTEKKTGDNSWIKC